MTQSDLVLVAYGKGDEADVWVDALRQHVPLALDVQPLARPVDPARVRYVVAWHHPPGSLAPFTAARAIFSIGAGVDHLVADPALPPDVPIVRFVDPDLTGRMSEWVLLNVLMHHRQVRLYDWQQGEKLWTEDLFQPAARDVKVGVMGLGVLGSDAAEKLRMVGYDVAGWSRTPKHVDGIDCFSGAADLDAFLGRTHILVVLLPLTPATRGMLNRDLFSKMARDSYFGGPILLNAGRGGLQNEADILACLEDGTLKAASLDVFEREPLPQNSPLWHHPAVTITPHNAAISSPQAIAAYIGGEIARIEAGERPRNTVDLTRAY